MKGCKNNDVSIVNISFDEDYCSHEQLKSELKEAVDQINRGEYIEIDEAFDRVIAQYTD
jgi:hypothetical protein